MATERFQGATGAGNRDGGRSVARSLREYGRGVAGGLLFSLPLLYTAEVWRLGQISGPVRLGAGLLGTLLLLIGYNRYAGLHPDASLAEVLIDSVEELGLGLAVAALVLWLLGQLDTTMHPDTLVGAVLLEGLLAAIGVSVGTAQLGGDPPGAREREAGRGPGSLLALGACGATLIGANVAPTEEIALIAAEVGGARLLGLMALGLGLTAVIGFFSEFHGGRRAGEAITARDVIRETAIVYTVALLVATALLWFFGQFDGVGPGQALARVVVLGIPATLGASAGRLLLQGQ